MQLVVKIIESDDGRYRAWCPSLPGVSARGDSRREVVTRVDREIRGYLASFDVPEPGQPNTVYEPTPGRVSSPAVVVPNSPSELRRPRPRDRRVFPAGYFTG